jgi:ribosomal protein S27AE
VTTQDLRRLYGREVDGCRRFDASSVGCDEGVFVADHLDDVAVKQNSAILHGPSDNRL